MSASTPPSPAGVHPSFSTRHPRGHYKAIVYYRDDPGQWVWSASASPRGDHHALDHVTVPDGSESWPAGSTQSLGWTLSSAVDVGEFGVWLNDEADPRSGTRSATTPPSPAGPSTPRASRRSASPRARTRPSSTTATTPGSGCGAPAPPAPRRRPSPRPSRSASPSPTAASPGPPARPSPSAGRSPRRSTSASSASGSTTRPIFHEVVLGRLLRRRPRPDRVHPELLDARHPRGHVQGPRLLPRRPRAVGVERQRHQLRGGDHHALGGVLDTRALG